MRDRTTTVIVEPRSLLREALVSLMESHPYRIAGSVASMTDIDRCVLEEGPPKLVILGQLPVDRVSEATDDLRRRWPGVKIVMLCEDGRSADFATLLASGIDGCLPMLASPDALMKTLQLIVGEQLRILMVSDSAISTPCINPRSPIGNSIPVPVVSASEKIGARDVLAKSSLDGAARADRARGLSDREDQILKALVRGESNKVIARAFTVTEATVKLYMKTINRKIGVANRTQAAIWALQNGYCVEAGRTMPNDAQTPSRLAGYN